MDIYNAKISPDGEYGSLTAGDARVLRITLRVGETAVDLTDATFETTIQANDGSNIVIPNVDHEIVVAADGTVDLTLSAARALKVRRGRSPRFMVKTTIDGIDASYWGEIDEVREPLR